jgi:hypothetical protein
LIPTYTFATAPECPGYKTKKDCLAIVDDNFRNFLDFIDETEEDNLDKKQELIQASLDIKKFETLACHKTCLY